MKSIRVIKTDSEYDEALAEVARLMEANPDRGTPEGDRFELLLTVVEVYEDKNYPIDLPDPIEAIKFMMEQNGLKNRDLAGAFGAASRVSEVLNRKRRLTADMMWALHSEFGIPAKVLIRPYELDKTPGKTESTPA